ncbi:MAG TPA: iron chelate uptake ABC transporter family permease subunit [Phycisphaerales bacterium]|nr:iron chelate uptake ABC transporter family permease subunit [Phycisphaerales bacterium]HMP38462.1 iron chelate uptake ABC transporter family permease subunit [Phycisphaerales bacterium]
MSWAADLIRLATLEDANTRIVLLGCGILGAAAGSVGSLAVLRGRALVGDAVAHAALPGVCLAWLVLGDRSLPVLLLGALGSGLLGVATIAAIRAQPRIREDAAIALVLSTFFGAGIVLSRMVQNVPGGHRAGLDGLILGSAASLVRQDVFAIGVVAAAALGAVLLFFKELRLLCFDRSFAASLGRPVGAFDLALLAAVCLIAIAGLPAVGVVLVVALLVIPGAAARFWSDRLAAVVILAGLFGAAAALAGTALSAVLPAPAGARVRGWPTGPLIALAAAGLFAGSLVAAPRRGLIARLLGARRLAAPQQGAPDALPEERSR